MLLLWSKTRRVAVVVHRAEHAMSAQYFKKNTEKQDFAFDFSAEFKVKAVFFA